MSEDCGPTEAHANLSISARIDRACDEFEVAWKQDRPVSIEDYLAGTPGDGQSKLFGELLQIELAYRQQAGQQPAIEDYLKRFPEQTETIRRIFPEVVKPRKLGDYELLEKLGSGGMGDVYKARQVLLNQIVALKVLPDDLLTDDQAVSRFKREMQLIGGLDHPNIVRAYNAGEAEGAHYLIMELVDGITLQELIAMHGILSVDTVCELIRQAAEGLQHAHRHGLVHRDIKPANLMLSRSGVVKILDLGLARFHADQQVTQQLTRPGLTMGTVDYMAPEQWEDSSGVDIRADIYSLGCTLYYLLTGKAPYSEKTYGTTRKKLMAHAVAPIPSLVEQRPDCPEELDWLLNRMLAKEANDRFDTPGEAAEALELFADPDGLTELLPTEREIIANSDVVSEEGLAKPDVDTRKKVARQSSPRRVRLSRRFRPKPWYRRRSTMIPLLVILAAAAGLGLWLGWPGGNLDPRQQQLRAELGSLPGLNGGWWFDETPWLIPGIRAAMIDHIDRRGAPTDNLLPGSLLEEIRSTDVAAVDRQLMAAASALLKQLPAEGREVASQMLVIDPEQHTEAEFEKDLTDIADHSTGSEQPTQLHLKAVILHRLTRWSEAADAYEAALKLYEEQNTAVELRALCAADYGRMFFDLKEYRKAIPKFRVARKLVDSRLFTVYCLCQEADAFRRWGDVEAAEETLNEAEQIAGAGQQPLSRHHPLKAAVFERRAWLDIDCWRLNEAKKLFEDANCIRKTNRDRGNPRSWRLILFNEQGRAMAEHFLGNQAQAVKIYRKLLKDIDDAVAGSTITKELTKKQKTELRQRRPNLYDRLSDCYLFGSSIDADEACLAISEAIKHAEDENFDQSSRWPHLNCLRYKLCLGYVLTGRRDEAQELFAAAEQIEHQKQQQHQLSSGQSRIFAATKQVAGALIELRSDDQLRRHKGRQTLEGIILNVKPGDVDRQNIEALLLATETLLGSDLTDQRLTGRITRRLMTITEGPRGSPDSEITQRYLQRYLRAAHAALKRSISARSSSDLEAEAKRIEKLLAQ